MRASNPIPGQKRIRVEDFLVHTKMHILTIYTIFMMPKCCIFPDKALSNY